jgi:Predicted membrane protein (DUF2232)
MLNRIGIALGSGLAAALLFCVTAKGSALAIMLAYLAPLPIMIAAVGWGVDAGALSSVVAAGVVAGVLDPLSGFIFWLTIAGPAAALAALAVFPLRNPLDRSNPTPSRASLGTLATTAAALGALVSAGALGAMVVIYGGYAQAVTGFRELLQPTITEAMGGGMGLPEELGADDIARVIIKYAPAAIATSTTLMLIVNLYVAARVAQFSQRLPRPWTDIPSQLKLPFWLTFLTVAAGLGWLFLPEPVNPFVAALAAPLTMIFAFQGLAVLHALSRRAPGRVALMFALYFAVFLKPSWVGVALALIGLAESVASFRARQTAKPFQR